MTAIADARAAVFPNQLKTALDCKGFLYLPNIGAQPEPPVARHELQHQRSGAGARGRHRRPRRTRGPLTVNLNAQIEARGAAGRSDQSLDRLFANDVVAIDADADCESFFLVSRGGNYVIGRRSTRRQARHRRAGQRRPLPDRQHPDRHRDRSAGASALTSTTRSTCRSRCSTSRPARSSTRDVPSSTPPEPGSFDHVRLLGKLVFFTALGVPDNGLVGTPHPRDRARWSSAASSRTTPGARAPRATTRARRRRDVDLRRRPAPDRSRSTASTRRSTARTTRASTTGARRATA